MRPPASDCTPAASGRELPAGEAAYSIRALRPDDADREAQFIAGLSERTRYERTLGLRRPPPRQRIQELVQVDGHERMAFVATSTECGEERFLGISRYVCGTEGAAEFAVVVSDAWQGRGLGSALMRTLIEHARAQGITRLYGDTLASNTRMLALARRLGMLPRFSGGAPGTYRATLALG